ncbi:MAG: efflux RND transporter periplasmic adaptor subunit [Cyanobacteria bacterium SIG31]|nr:efflux RND transporter periplasmic adaptor subunit [Cyanobacteria bacterium SIG31]
MRKNVIIIILIAIILILGRMFLSNWDRIKTAKARAGASVPVVSVEPIASENVIRQFEAPARVVAKYRVDVLARISGYLTKSYFKEGDYVKAGQVLFEIEPEQYQYAASQAKANLDNIQSQADYYQKQLSRYEELVKQDYVAKSDYDNILAQKNAYNAQVESAISAYRDAQRNLGYTKVKSPVNGRVGLISVTVGNFVSMASQPLTTINSSEPMYVTFPLDAKDYVELVRVDKSANVDRNVDFIFSTGRKYELQGVQDFHDNKIDETTGTIILRATFPNPNDELIQGDFGTVIIYSKSKDEVPVVPQSATMENQEGRFVYVLDEQDLPRMVYIKTGGQTNDGKWIISSGVKAGERIVTSGLQKIMPGRPVKIINTSTEKPVEKENVTLLKKLSKKVKK